MDSKSGPLCQKFQEESYEYINQLLSMQQDSIKGIHRLNRDISSMFNSTRKEFDQVHKDAMQSYYQQMRQIAEEEERKIAEIRSAKPSALISQMQSKPKPAQSLFLKLKLPLRKQIKISKSWKANKIPRPVWGLIFEYCDEATIAKMERVCKSFFLLINPMCECSNEKGDTNCKSFWKISARQKVKEKYEDGNCSYFRRSVMRDIAPIVFGNTLEMIKATACAKGIHDWQVSAENSGFLRCPYCTRGCKRQGMCSGTCAVHDKCCVNEARIYKTCPSHSCIICTNSRLSRLFDIIDLIKIECSEFSIYPKVKLTFKTKID